MGKDKLKKQKKKKKEGEGEKEEKEEEEEEVEEKKKALCHEHIYEKPSPISGEKRERELPRRRHSKSQASRRSCHVGRIDQQACYF